MGLVNSINETNEKAAEVGEIYLKKSYKYYKLKFFQQLSVSVSMVFKALIIGGFLFTFIFLASIALALQIGETTKNYPYGFFMVSLFFLVLAIIGYFLKNIVNKIIIKKLSKKFFN